MLYYLSKGVTKTFILKIGPRQGSMLGLQFLIFLMNRIQLLQKQLTHLYDGMIFMSFCFGGNEERKKV